MAGPVHPVEDRVVAAGRGMDGGVADGGVGADGGIRTGRIRESVR